MGREGVWYGPRPVAEKPVDPNLQLGLDKLKRPDVYSGQPVEKGAPLEDEVAGGLETVNDPKIIDFVNEARKLVDPIQRAKELSLEQTRAQAQILGQNTGDVAGEFARQLYGKNLGATSGVGQQLTQKAIAEQAGRLEPYARQQAAELGMQELQYQNKKTEDNFNRKWNGIMDGTIDKSQMTAQEWLEAGITNPNSIKTLAETDWDAQIEAKGWDPKNPADREKFKVELRGQEKNKLKSAIMANYQAANQGAIPDPQDLEMLMYIYGQGSGLLTPEEESALVAQFNADQWDRSMKYAEAMNPPDDGSHLCTVIYNQGKISEEVYREDALVGRFYQIYDRHTYIGYSLWAKPLADKMRKSKVLSWLLTPFIKAWANQMYGDRSLLGSLLLKVGVPICRRIGVLHFKNAKPLKEAN